MTSVTAAPKIADARIRLDTLIPTKTPNGSR